MEIQTGSHFNKEYGLITRRLIRLLSSNSRISVTELSHTLKISRKNVAKRLKKIENEFSIKYTLALSLGRMGLQSPHMIAVRFGIKPDYKKIRELLESSPIPQLVFRCKGLYDMVIYANARSMTRYAKWDRSIRAELAMKYKMRWYQSEVVFRRLGFFPAREDAIDSCRILDGEKKMLKILNQNSRISFKELAKKLGLNYKTTIYRFNELVKKEYIKRFTIVMGLQEGLSFISIFSKYMPPEDTIKAKNITKEIFTTDDDNALVSRWLLKTSLIGSYDSYALGVFDNFSDGYKYGVKLYRSSLKRFAPVTTSYAQVVEVLVGSLPIRSVDLKKEFREHMTPQLKSE